MSHEAIYSQWERGMQILAFTILVKKNSLPGNLPEEKAFTFQGSKILLVDRKTFLKKLLMCYRSVPVACAAAGCLKVACKSCLVWQGLNVVQIKISYYNNNMIIIVVSFIACISVTQWRSYSISYSWIIGPNLFYSTMLYKVLWRNLHPIRPGTPGQTPSLHDKCTGFFYMH